MKEHPIIFSGPMVQALLRAENPKTQTRRAVKPQPKLETNRWWCDGGKWMPEGPAPAGGTRQTLGWMPCPYGAPGDRLWVRETCGTGGHFPHPWAYRADGVEYPGERWTPAIHMPRRASRIMLEITDVRVQRLQQISQEDCWAEGIDDEGADYNDGERYASAGSPVSPERYAFTSLWESINGLRDGCSWEANPWVWALTFQKVTP